MNRHPPTAASLFWSKSVQRAYDRRHKGQPNKVQLNDAVFALHAAFISFVTLAQVRAQAAQPMFLVFYVTGPATSVTPPSDFAGSMHATFCGGVKVDRGTG